MTRELVVVAAYDSQMKWAVGLAKQFEAAGWTWSVLVPSDLRHAISDDQLSAAGAAGYQLMPWNELLVAAREADCVILSLQGPLVERFTDDLALLRRDQPRPSGEPVVVTGWVGIIIEKIVAGYLDRARSDVIAVNSADNLREFLNAGQRLEIPADNLLLSGLPLLPIHPAEMKTGPIRTVLLADQPTIPRDSWDRTYLYQRLFDYAAAHPDRRVLLKPRHRPEESTFHRAELHPEAAIKMLPAAPVNFEITYEPITDLLGRVDLLLTVSSTAALESIGAGVRTAFIGDFGVHEKHGNHVLINSGLIVSFDKLIADLLPTPDPSWLADVFVSVDELAPAERILKRVTELLDIDPSERPSAICSRDGYLSSRLAIHEARKKMPSVAQRPAARGTTYRPRIDELRRRAAQLGMALLPGDAYRRLRAIVRH
ncbi:hypothetical protein ATK74_2946 [Propionicimonas paludicola]|uniref:CDP-glycerol:poly(Glycerophosphate) glycerophosphotransferase n=1 Tax=Propionicimonas paludicola TaxID=185243 RepID=A0A2A9CW50_9ACTN|nr:DUF6716 putative glycosyltransferase [Propionicimonas paludicola]PFG18361.1 hypothetical protein ATK74_2946 [Propionicimonas paludicola]